jgi:hypothetical protein
MNKIKIVIVMTVAVLTLSLSSCKKNKCEDAAKDMTTAAQNWASKGLDATKADCEAYKKEVSDLLNDCDSFNGSDAAKTALDALDCSSSIYD